MRTLNHNPVFFFCFQMLITSYRSNFPLAANRSSRIRFCHQYQSYSYWIPDIFFCCFLHTSFQNFSFILTWTHNFLLIQVTCQLSNIHSIKIFLKYHLHNRRCLRINHEAGHIFIRLQISIRCSRSHIFSSFLTLYQSSFYFNGSINAMMFVNNISETNIYSRHTRFIFHTINIIIDCYESHIHKWKNLFQICVNLYMIPAESRKVFHYNCADFSISY